MRKFWFGLKKTAVCQLLLAILLGLTSFLASAHDLALTKNYPSTYVVKKGDTLWDISGMYLQHPWDWPELWQVNPQINNPHLIYPGDVLTLVFIDGKPRLVLNRGEMKLSPTIRTSELGAPIAAIPADVLSSFLSRSRVVGEEDLESAPYVLAGSDHRILGSAGDRLYGRGPFDTQMNFYGIYRGGKSYTDPVTDEFLGLQALEIGTGKIIGQRPAKDKGEKTDYTDLVATVALNYTAEEVRVGDRFLPVEREEIPSTFYPKQPDQDLKGLIIAVEGGVSNVGPYDVVTVNLGSREGAKIGDVLAIKRQGEKVSDPFKRDKVTLPNERAGLMMVFKVFEKVSYGLVLEADQGLMVMDEVTNP